MRLSVALVTRDRPESLARCLQSWRAQITPPAEIIVSDDSNPTHARQVQELARQFDCRYAQGPQRGLYANRNQASLNCGGSHIISADDDHTHPANYVCRLQELVALDPARVWILGERHPDRPRQPLECPPELHPSGAGQRPRDPGSCAAIADGASIYPRSVFERGLRYDESYPFGPLWYLWGQQLSRRGWRISFSDSTFIWHHIQPSGPLTAWNDFHVRLEATLYVAWVYALWLNPSPRRLSYALLTTVRRMIFSAGFGESRRGCRLPWQAALRAAQKARSAQSAYQLRGSSNHVQAPGFTTKMLTSQTPGH